VKPVSRDRLRVLLITTSRQIWGAERSVLALAPLLARRGIDVTLGSPAGGELEDEWCALGLDRLSLELPTHAGIRPEGNADGRPSPAALAAEAVTTARTSFLIARAARPFDLIHSNSLWVHMDAALAGRMARRPVVIELHDLVLPGLGRKLLGVSERLAAATIAISRAVADVIGTGEARGVRIVPQAVDLQRWSPGPADPAVRRSLTDDAGALLVGIVGRIDPMKGIDVLVRAMAHLTGPSGRARLVVVGSPGLDDGGYERTVKADADRLLGDRVRFVGPRADVPDVLRSLDVLVNASSAEPFGLTVLEAQASGVPVVAASSGGIVDFVRDGDNGLLVPPGDAAALARALERLCEDPELRIRLGRRGRETAEATHSLDHRADSLAEIYRAVAGRTRKASSCAR
jgi:glycosyltransferase involved in cell wall biosynthesis